MPSVGNNNDEKILSNTGWKDRWEGREPCNWVFGIRDDNNENPLDEPEYSIYSSNSTEDEFYCKFFCTAWRISPRDIRVRLTAVIYEDIDGEYPSTNINNKDLKFHINSGLDTSFNVEVNLPVNFIFKDLQEIMEFNDSVTIKNCINYSNTYVKNAEYLGLFITSYANIFGNFAIPNIKETINKSDSLYPNIRFSFTLHRDERDEEDGNTIRNHITIEFTINES